MKWDTDTTARLNLALDEAELIGAEVDSEECVAGLTLAVLSLPEEGPAPEDRRVQIILRPVGRVAASLRHGAWNDDSAEVEPFQVDALLSIVKRFGASAIYGGKFFDVPKDKDFRNWKDRLSLDWWAPDAEAGTRIPSTSFRRAKTCIWTCACGSTSYSSSDHRRATSRSSLTSS